MQKNKPWYKRKEFWGSLLTGASTVLTMFDQKTVAYQIGIGIGSILTITGLRKGYQANNLPSGISKVMDIIPDKVTGKREKF